MKCVRYSYYIELRGQRAALVRLLSPIKSSEELLRHVVGDPANFQRVYDLLAPRDIDEVILNGDTFDFLICGDLEFFKNWLEGEILLGRYTCVEHEFETPF